MGYENELKLSYSDDGTYFFDKIPPGERDFVITAQSTEEATNLTGDGHGIRLNKVKILAGIRGEQGEIELPKMGSISGTATLIGQNDHSGIRVSIPGTGYQAVTDADGRYTIGPFVPPGENSIIYEKEGYHRGQNGLVNVGDGEQITAPEIALAVSTGAEGFIKVLTGDKVTLGEGVDIRISTSREIELLIGASEDATLMMISEYQSFEGAKWEPVISSIKKTFDTDGYRAFFIKFANANGLESSHYSAYVLIDTSAPNISNFSLGSAASYEPRQKTTSNQTINVNLSYSDYSDYYVDPGVEYRVSENPDLEGAEWKKARDYPKTFTLSEGIGPKKVYLQTRDGLGHVSEIVSQTIDYTVVNHTEGFEGYCYSGATPSAKFFATPISVEDDLTFRYMSIGLNFSGYEDPNDSIDSIKIFDDNSGKPGSALNNATEIGRLMSGYFDVNRSEETFSTSWTNSSQSFFETPFTFEGNGKYWAVIELNEAKSGQVSASPGSPSFSEVKTSNDGTTWSSLNSCSNETSFHLRMYFAQ